MAAVLGAVAVAGLVWGLWRLPVRIRLLARVRGGRAELRVAAGLPGRPVLRRRYAWSVTGCAVFPPRLELRPLCHPHGDGQPGRPGRGARGGRQDGGPRRAGGDRLVVSSEAVRRWARNPRWTFLREVARRARRAELDVDAEVGTGDAATTALAAGAVWAALAGAAALLPGAFRSMPPRVRVRPHYGGGRLAGRARCIGDLRGGDIILAGLLALRDRVSRNLVRGVASPRAGGRPEGAISGADAAGTSRRRGGPRRWTTPSRA